MASSHALLFLWQPTRTSLRSVYTTEWSYIKGTLNFDQSARDFTGQLLTASHSLRHQTDTNTPVTSQTPNKSIDETRRTKVYKSCQAWMLQLKQGGCHI